MVERVPEEAGGSQGSGGQDPAWRGGGAPPLLRQGGRRRASVCREFSVGRLKCVAAEMGSKDESDGKRSRGLWERTWVRDPERVTGQHQSLLMLKRVDLRNKSLCGHAVDFRALRSPRGNAGRSNQ